MKHKKAMILFVVIPLLLLAVVFIFKHFSPEKRKYRSLEKGYIYLKQGKWQNAIDNLKIALSFDKENNETRYHLALAYYYAEEYHKADSLLHEVISTEKNKDAYKILTKILIHYEKFVDAKNIVTRLLEIDSKDAESWFLYGIILQKNNEQAESSFNKAISLDADFLKAYVELAKIHWNRNEKHQAIQLLQAKSNTEELDLEIGLHLANFLLAEAAYDKSYLLTKRLEKLYPSELSKLIPIQICIFLAKKDFTKVRSLLENFEGKNIYNNEDPRLVYARGILYILDGKYSFGINDLLWFHRSYPNFIDTYYYLARAYKATNKVNLAIVELEKSLEIEPNNLSTRLYLIEILIEQQLWKQTEQQCFSFLKINPNDKLVKEYHIQSLLQLEKVKTIHQLYGSMLKGTPQASWLKFIQGKQQQALQELESLKTQQYQAHYFLAQAYLSQKKIILALQNLNIYLEHDPDNFNARVLLAKIRTSQKLFPEALNIYLSLLRDYPNNKQIKLNILNIQTQFPSDILIGKEGISETPEFYEHMAKLEMNKQNYSNAIDFLSRIDTKNIQQLILLGKMYLAQGDYHKATNSFFHAHIQKPNSVHAIHFSFGKMLCKDFSSALSILKNLKQELQNSETKTFLAILYLRDKQPEKAQTILQKILPTNDNTKYLAAFYIAQQKFTEAQNIINQNIKSFYERTLWGKLVLLSKEKQIDIMPVLLGEYAVQMGYDAWMIKQYQEMHHKQPNSFIANMLAHLYYKNGEHSKAVDIWAKCVTDDISAAFRLAEVYITQHRWQQASVLLQKIADHYTDYDVFLLQAKWYAKQRKYDEAQNYYIKAQKIAQQNNIALDVAFHNNFAWALLHSLNRNTTSALRHAKKAYSFLPYDAGVVDTLGWAYFYSENYSQAILHLENANLLLPKNPSILYHLASSYYKHGQKQKAKNILVAICTLDFPEKTTAQAILQKLEKEESHGG